jgi:hypothetical protein
MATIAFHAIGWGRPAGPTTAPGFTETLPDFG